jgi:hypothetical protein
MGSFSLILRAPVVALSDALGGDHLFGYQLGVLLCFIPALIVGSGSHGKSIGAGSRLEAVACAVIAAVLVALATISACVLAAYLTAVYGVYRAFEAVLTARNDSRIARSRCGTRRA